ncbi:MAG: antibiotic biosynthesis monooxygenase [Nitratireductor sp.]|nr:antibiotic biosynthesis monooxygenase [Nitratireductor sp.]
MEHPDGTVLLSGHIDVPADRLAAVEVALAEHVRLTRAEAGCIFFNVDPDPAVAGRFSVSEAFVHQAAFDHHQQRAGGSPWAAASQGIPRRYEIRTVGGAERDRH